MLLNGGYVMGILLITKIKNRIYEKLKKNKYEEELEFDEVKKLTIEEVKNARSNFHDADKDAVDLAIYELMAAEERLNLLIKDRKKKQ